MIILCSSLIKTVRFQWQTNKTTVWAFLPFAASWEISPAENSIKGIYLHTDKNIITPDSLLCVGFWTQCQQKLTSHPQQIFPVSPQQAHQTSSSALLADQGGWFLRPPHPDQTVSALPHLLLSLRCWLQQSEQSHEQKHHSLLSYDLFSKAFHIPNYTGTNVQMIND